MEKLFESKKYKENYHKGKRRNLIRISINIGDGNNLFYEETKSLRLSQVFSLFLPIFINIKISNSIIFHILTKFEDMILCCLCCKIINNV